MTERGEGTVRLPGVCAACLGRPDTQLRQKLKESIPYGNAQTKVIETTFQVPICRECRKKVILFRVLGWVARVVLVLAGLLGLALFDGQAAGTVASLVVVLLGWNVMEFIRRDPAELRVRKIVFRNPEYQKRFDDLNPER